MLPWADRIHEEQGWSVTAAYGIYDVSRDEGWVTRYGAICGEQHHSVVEGDGPQFAVTAAHCLSHADGIDVGTTVVVEQYNTTALNLGAFDNQAQVDQYQAGTTSSAWFRPSPLAASDGYVVTSYSCTVIERCDSTYGAVSSNCPFNKKDVDTGIIQCSQRAKTGLNWEPVQTMGDGGGENIEICWFHEILNLTTNGVDQIYQPFNNATYYELNPMSTGNFHYFQNRLLNAEPQLLPLRSKWAIGGTPYHTLSTSTNGPKFLDTNVPGCHGTSGSGVFLADVDIFLGNVVNGNANWTSTYLCDPNLSSGPQSNLQIDYIRASLTAQLQAETNPNITGDRHP
jgi:hypothetical protein